MEKARSRDGTAIAFDRLGEGPPAILVGGAFQTRSDTKLGMLAALLAEPPHTPRGSGGPFPAFPSPRRNRDRFVFLYDAERVTPLEEVGEVTIPPAEIRHIRLEGVPKAFEGFDRNLYLAAFRAGKPLPVPAGIEHAVAGGDRHARPAGRRHRLLRGMRVVGHRDFGGTVCPGDNLYPITKKL